MNQIKRWLVWLSRINHCRGFGIQSPTDYAFVRYVVNEHWPYYQYDNMGTETDWLSQKLERLYFRVANWRQPETVADPDALPCWQMGCKKAKTVNDAPHIELMRLPLNENERPDMDYIYNKVDNQSVVIVEALWRNPKCWQQIVSDERTGITFDLYYCGIVMFDKKRTKQHYIINF